MDKQKELREDEKALQEKEINELKEKNIFETTYLKKELEKAVNGKLQLELETE